MTSKLAWPPKRPYYKKNVFLLMGLWDLASPPLSFSLCFSTALKTTACTRHTDISHRSNWTWTEASIHVSQNKHFLFLTWLSQAFCCSSGNLTNVFHYLFIENIFFEVYESKKIVSYLPTWEKLFGASQWVVQHLHSEEALIKLEILRQEIIPTISVLNDTTLVIYLRHVVFCYLKV